MKQTVAAYIAKTLEQAGVKRIWGVTGDSLNGLSDSLNRMGTIDWMPTRHEEVAAFAAGAEAQLTGELAVCAGSCGPGTCILLTVFSTATATMFRCWPSPPIFLPAKSAAVTFRKRIRRSCFANAATTANWSPRRSRSRRCWPSLCAKR